MKFVHDEKWGRTVHPTYDDHCEFSICCPDCNENLEGGSLLAFPDLDEYHAPGLIIRGEFTRTDVYCNTGSGTNHLWSIICGNHKGVQMLYLVEFTGTWDEREQNFGHMLGVARSHNA